MRPADLRDHLVDLLKNTPDVQRVEVMDSGPHPYAVTATVAGKEHTWQVIGQLADGAKHDTPTAPVHGEPAVYTAAPITDAPDAWLGGVIGAAEAPDTQRIDVWSTRGNADPGLTVFFHNGERAFVRLV
ncbi:hypothetical protein ACFWNK_06660 [Streptomyces sp. NPDC058417]|uniref:hypothetical protein n=1 Tax=unclassified Streptomyces TaxID=2593676 RepID=UPI00364E1E6E